MNIFKAITAGFIGSLTLNFLHLRVRPLSLNFQSKNYLNEPINLDSFEQINDPLIDNRDDYDKNLLSNIISNTLFFSTIGFGKPQNFYFRGLTLGLAAGLSAAKWPDKINLKKEQIEMRKKSNVTTAAIYIAGGLVTAALLSLLKKK
ncbi:hypothetical protein ABIB40_001520 [Pedobacter sp. UYP30]|uniref:hypothetical protein n=1 Tax=Pedobacter sp. UYP30 TaxID=1756400 RepID=UPI003399116E